MIRMNSEEYERKEEEKEEVQEEKSSFQSELLDAIEDQREEIEEEEVEEEVHTQAKMQIEEEEEIQEEFEEEYKEDRAEEEEKEITPKKLDETLPTEDEKKKEEQIVYSHIVVDLWRTKMHRQEWGIRLDAQRAQKDRQWTRDMDLIGLVKINDKDYGHLALREKIWKETDPLERRFVMKMFSPSGYWRGSIERLQGESFAISHATKEPCPAFICIFKHTRNLFRIKRLAHYPRFQGQVFGFSYLDENDIFRSFVFDDKRLTPGSDWMVKDIHDKIIAKINGKFANLGGKFKIDIYDEKLATDKTFFNMLILFSSTLRFLKGIKKNIKKSLKELKNTDTDVKLDDSESNLYLNPRKLSI
ncbi:MAG: hypothetical protein HGN29_06690 [Asgard group archaeon]|nr:hypothetical protein [Asgard group archaeon]